MDKKVAQEHASFVELKNKTEIKEKELNKKIQTQATLISKNEKEAKEMKDKIHAMTGVSKSLVQT